jgi:multisubunit Na+/H+ antiporter MnhB subunit
MSTSVLRVILIIVLLSIFELGLAIAIFLMPEPTISMTELVHSQLSETELTHSVTALLLNYRSMDMLLGLAILFIALQCVLHRNDSTVSSQKPDDSDFSLPSLHWILMLIVLTTGILFWTERYLVAGALLAGCGVLLRFNHLLQPQPTAGLSLRLGLSSGLLVFISIALATMVSGYHWLEYPEGWVNESILLISVCLTISIGLTLTILFFGAPGISWHKEK